MPDERPLTAEQRERIEAIRAELLRIERYTVTWPGGRALKRIPEMLPDDIGYDVRFVQMLRLMHRLLDAVGSSVYEYRNDYDRYIDSPEWSRLSRETITARGSRCERCGASRADGTLAPGLVLVVHHKTYERVGHELPEDLEVLCEPCHRREHGLPELPVHAATIPATPEEGGESRGGAGTVTAWYQCGTSAVPLDDAGGELERAAALDQPVEHMQVGIGDREGVSHLDVVAEVERGL